MLAQDEVRHQDIPLVIYCHRNDGIGTPDTDRDRGDQRHATGAAPGQERRTGGFRGDRLPTLRGGQPIAGRYADDPVGTGRFTTIPTSATISSARARTSQHGGSFD